MDRLRIRSPILRESLAEFAGTFIFMASHLKQRESNLFNFVFIDDCNIPKGDFLGVMYLPSLKSDRQPMADMKAKRPTEVMKMPS